jgi:hypothetical protein
MSNKESRHGKRAPGQTSCTFNCSEEEKAAYAGAADHDKRSLSNWINYELSQVIAERKKRAATGGGSFETVRVNQSVDGSHSAQPLQSGHAKSKSG